MVNNRIIFATTQLAIKDNKADPTSLPMGLLADATLASGITAGHTGTTGLNESVSGIWPVPGQFKIKNGANTAEFVRYTSFVDPSGIVISERGTAGTTATAQLSGATLRLTGWEIPFGVQSASFGTTFNLESVFQLGQLDPYENVEGIPEIEVGIERILDGTKLLYLMLTDDDFTSLKGRTSRYKADIAVNVYPDTQDSAIDSPAPDSTVTASGMFLSAWSATMPADGSNFTESVTLVGNDKSWGAEEGVPSGIFLTSDAYDARVVGSGVQRSEDFDRDASTLPGDLPTFDHLQQVEVSVDITREEINELGLKGPFFRPVTFPVTVTSTFETTTDKGDLVDALSNGRDNLVDRTIILKTKGGLRIDLGTKNKLSSTQFDGFDAGGGDAAVTLEYTNDNKLDITHDAFLGAFDTNLDLPGFAL